MLVHSRFTGRAQALAIAAIVLSPLAAAAQGNIVPCDFDIQDNYGTLMWGNTLHLVGRSGASSNVGEFILINANTPAQDVDQDGYALSCDFNALFVPDQYRTPLVNVANPSLAIPAENVVLRNMPTSLPSSKEARVQVFVELPPGTIAGTYRGEFQVRDNIKRPYSDPSTAEPLNLDRLFVEVTVQPERGIAVLSPDSAALIDSVVVRARAGTRGSAVFRLADTGNAPLSNVQISASDLRSESAVGITIPASRISFTPPTLAALVVGDTARITVNVDVPRGILGGRYRGSIFVSSDSVSQQEIPLVLIVSSARGILFADNPVHAALGDVANIAFNGDPGTKFQLGIFDMAGLLVFRNNGVVFPGTGGVAGAPGVGADYAVNVIWPLVNGSNQPVASGMYLVVVESIVNGKRQLAKDKLMVIR